MKVYGKTDIGKKRSTNQDTFRLSENSDELVWLLVCDGMGGVIGGDIASSTACETIENILRARLNTGCSEEEIKDIMVSAVSEGNSQVFAKSVDNPELKGMGTTAVLAVILKNRLFVAHVGDSRAYLYSGGTVTQITEDHSYVQDLVNHGDITKEQARTHPHKNIITRSLGVHSIVETDFASFELSQGDVLIICSDGLSDYATDEVLADILQKNGENESIDALIEYALACGGNDNITVTAAYV